MRTWDLTQKTPTSNGNELKLEFGQIKLVSDLDALRVKIDSNLQVIKGELDDADKGVDYFGIVLSNTPLQMKVQEISRVVMDIPEVASITLLDAKQDPRTHVLTLHFLIKSVYGDLDYNKAFEVTA